MLLAGRRGPAGGAATGQGARQEGSGAYQGGAEDIADDACVNTVACVHSATVDGCAGGAATGARARLVAIQAGNHGTGEERTDQWTIRAVAVALRAAVARCADGAVARWGTFDVSVRAIGLHARAVANHRDVGGVRILFGCAVGNMANVKTTIRRRRAGRASARGRARHDAVRAIGEQARDGRANRRSACAADPTASAASLSASADERASAAHRHSTTPWRPTRACGIATAATFDSAAAASAAACAAAASACRSVPPLTVRGKARVIRASNQEQAAREQPDQNRRCVTH